MVLPAITLETLAFDRIVIFSTGILDYLLDLLELIPNNYNA
jgi:hypothetical protein